VIEKFLKVQKWLSAVLTAETVHFLRIASDNRRDFRVLH
jgi:hypothetical protein